MMTDWNLLEFCISKRTNLVHVSPVLAVVIEALPHHAHDF